MTMNKGGSLRAKTKSNNTFITWIHNSITGSRGVGLNVTKMDSLNLHFLNIFVCRSLVMRCLWFWLDTLMMLSACVLTGKCWCHPAWRESSGYGTPAQGNVSPTSTVRGEASSRVTDKSLCSGAQHTSLIS